MVVTPPRSVATAAPCLRPTRLHHAPAGCARRPWAAGFVAALRGPHTPARTRTRRRGGQRSRVFPRGVLSAVGSVCSCRAPLRCTPGTAVTQCLVIPLSAVTDYYTGQHPDVVPLRILSAFLTFSISVRVLCFVRARSRAPAGAEGAVASHEASPGARPADVRNPTVAAALPCRCAGCLSRSAGLTTSSSRT